MPIKAIATIASTVIAGAVAVKGMEIIGKTAQQTKIKSNKINFGSKKKYNLKGI